MPLSDYLILGAEIASAMKCFSQRLLTSKPVIVTHTAQTTAIQPYQDKNRAKFSWNERD